jgi:hypothetical protein
MISERWTGNDLEGSGRSLLFDKYPDIHLEGLTKIKKNLCQDSRSPSRDLNARPPEYAYRALAMMQCVFFVSNVETATNEEILANI